jgi:electron transfer flavoprotein alpha subunit
MGNILVVAENAGGKLKSVSYEVFTAAKQIAETLNSEVTALVFGQDAAKLGNEAGEYGISNVIAIESDKLQKYSPDVAAHAVAAAAKEVNADVVIAAATFTGKDLMPRVAMLLDSALAQDCVNYKVENGKLVLTRPMYAGKVLADVTVNGGPVLVTFRPKTFKPASSPTSANVKTLAVDLPDPLAVVEAVESSTGGKLDVTQADIVVSGGRGLKGPENWHLIENLANVLGAATGCSRPVSDEGWRPHGEHVGQTGKTVSANLYIAIGISGAIQHIAGISSSKYIVAINKDPEAPIFKVADYGIVGDLFEVVPALTEEIKKLKAQD